MQLFKPSSVSSVKHHWIFSSLFLLTLFTLLFMSQSTALGQEETKITPSDGQAGSYFGSGLSFANNRMLIGAHGANSGAGKAYVYDYDGSTGRWALRGVLEQSLPETDDRMGQELGFDGNHAILNVKDRPSQFIIVTDGVYFFSRNTSDNSWTQTGRETLTEVETSSGVVSVRGFGDQVAMHNETAAISAVQGTNTTTIFLYNYNASERTWFRTGEIIPEDPQNVPTISAMEYRDNRIIFGDYNALSGEGVRSGKVHVYSVNSDFVGSRETIFTSSDAHEGDLFGWDVDLEGDRAVIGARGDDQGGTNAGAIYVFDFNLDSNTWEQSAKLLTDEPSAEEGFGNAVSISGNRVMGATINDRVFTFIYNAATGTWQQETPLEATDASSGDDNYGITLESESDFSIVGSSLNNANELTNSGAVYVYNFGVTPVNSPPIARTDRVSVPENTNVIIDVLGNDEDPDGDPLTITEVGNPTNGSASITAGNTISYDPNTGYIGSDTFGYVITDGHDHFIEGTVEISVTSGAPSLIAGGEAEQQVNDSLVVRHRIVSLDFTVIRELIDRESERLTLNPFTDIRYTAEQSRLEQWTPSQFTWYGDILEDDRGWVHIDVDTERQLAYASMWLDNTQYNIRPQGNNSIVQEMVNPDYRLHEHNVHEPIMDSTEIPIYMETLHLERARWGSGTGEPVVQNKNQTVFQVADPVVDVLIFYNTDAKDRAGGRTAINMDIRAGINNANFALRNSGVNGRIRLVGTVETALANASSTDTVNSKDAQLEFMGKILQDGGFFSARSKFNQLRDNLGGDIVGFVGGYLKGAPGWGKVLTDPNDADNRRENTIFTVRWTSLRGFTLPHEIGHNLGAKHDRAEADGEGAYSYSYGFVNPLSDYDNLSAADSMRWWRTIMAYSTVCKGCPPVWRYSNPDSSINGDPMGVASGSNSADNVRTFNNTMPLIQTVESAPHIVAGTITNSITGQPANDVLVSTSNGYFDVTESDGYYEIPVKDGESVTLTYSKSSGDYVFNPPSFTFTGVDGDRSKNVSMTRYFSIRGSIFFNANGLSGIEVRGGPAGRVLTASDGSYSVRVPQNWTGTLTPYSRQYEFSPPDRTYNPITANIAGNNYNASVAQYTISGYITETLTGDPVRNVILSGFPTLVDTDNNGYYEITLDYGWSGHVILSKDGYNFDPFDENYVNLSLDLEHDYDAYEGWIARSDWPMEHSNPQHNSIFETAPTNGILAWTASLGSGAMAPVIGPDRTIFVGDQNNIHAFMPDGTVKNEWSTPIPITEDMVTSPTVGSNGSLYYGYANGVMKYSFIKDTTIFSHPIGENLLSTLVIDNDGRAYAGDEDGVLHKILLSSGSRRTLALESPIHSTPAISDNGILYVGTDDGKVRAITFAAYPPNINWEFQTGDQVRSSPTIARDGTILAGSDDGYLYAINPDGTQKWRANLGGNIRTSPAIDAEGNVYAGSTNGTFYAYDESGNQIWRYSTGGSITSSPVISQLSIRRFVTLPDEEHVYVGSEDGKMYAFVIRSTNGNDAPVNGIKSPAWSYDAGSPIVRSPALGTNGLYFVTDDATLHALESGSEAQSQIAILVNDMGVSSAEDVHIIVWMNEQGGPLGIIGEMPEDDPCGGGPLIMPDCEFGDGGTFGSVTPLTRIMAEEDLVIGLATPENLDAVITGESTTGLLGTFETRLSAGENSTIVLGGLLDPNRYADNPDGLATELSLFKKEGLEETVASQERSYVYTGHFSTDAPAMSLTLSGPDEYQFESLSYGQMSNVQSLAAGQYEATLSILESSSSRQKLQSYNFSLDLQERNGEPVALLMAGFLNPDLNEGGHTLNMHTATSDGVRSVPITSEPDLPEAFMLYQNYPNPFNPSTTIPFALSQPSHVRIDVYDITGRWIKKLVGARYEAGNHYVRFEGDNLASGLYLIRAKIGNQSFTKKMTFLK